MSAEGVAASPQPDWLALEVTQAMIDKLCSSTDKMVPNKATITVPELTLRLGSFCLVHASVCLWVSPFAFLSFWPCVCLCLSAWGLLVLTSAMLAISLSGPVTWLVSWVVQQQRHMSAPYPADDL